MSNVSSSSFARSRALVSASLRGVARHPRLLAFPFITLVFMLGTLVFTARFCLTADYLAATGYGWDEFAHWQELTRRLYADGGHLRLREGAYVWLAVQYLATMFVGTFVNVALTSQSLRAFAGDSVSVRAGLRCALERVHIIFLWSLFAGLVGLILERLASYFGWAGRLGLHLAGMTWSVASVFVIPMIIRDENTDPITLLRKSSGLIRKTWGEGLVGFVFIGIIGMVPFIMAFMASMIWVSVAQRGSANPDASALFTGAWVVGFLGLAWVADFTRTCFRGALYVYASEGVVPEPYTAELMDGSWKVRK